MWVGTGNNLTFRGVSPRIESQAGGDPFAQQNQPFNPAGLQLSSDGEPGNYIIPEGMNISTPSDSPQPVQGTPPSDPFRKEPAPSNNPPDASNPPQSSSSSGTQPVNPASQSFAARAVKASDTPAAPQVASQKASATMLATMDPDTAALRLAPRMAPQPATIYLSPGESKVWEVIGMDLEGLTASQLVFRYDPRAMAVTDVSIGSAVFVNLDTPPIVAVNRDAGTITVTQGDGKPLRFTGGGQVLAIRVSGGNSGETFLVMENPDLHTASGQTIVAAVAGGRARVQ
jgi:hypothetical protein